MEAYVCQKDDEIMNNVYVCNKNWNRLRRLLSGNINYYRLWISFLFLLFI